MKHLVLATRLRSDFDMLSSRFQDAARWMIDHPADVALLTTREQARGAGVSPATLTRLAQRFGLEGYDDVRKLYADAMRRPPEEFRGRARPARNRGARHEKFNRAHRIGLFARRRIRAGEDARPGRHAEKGEGDRHLHDRSSRKLAALVVTRRRLATGRFLDRIV